MVKKIKVRVEIEKGEDKIEVFYIPDQTQTLIAGKRYLLDIDLGPIVQTLK